jgi:hypothetical protein
MPPVFAAPVREPSAPSDVVPVAKARGRSCREQTMRVFLGIIIGIVLTVASAYISDSLETGSLINGPTTTGATSARAEQHKPVVNWDVVGDNWHALGTWVRHTWTQRAG